METKYDKNTEDHLIKLYSALEVYEEMLVEKLERSMMNGPDKHREYLTDPGRMTLLGFIVDVQTRASSMSWIISKDEWGQIIDLGLASGDSE